MSELAQKYVSELGATAYALLNTISDFASQPPENSCVRRDRHALQRLAGRWLAEFSTEVQQGGFDVRAYLQGLSERLATA